MKPYFSIVIPCCDVELYLRECLESVLGQAFTDWECLLWVEASKDRTEEIAREFEANEERIRVFTGPRSGSPATPRNAALRVAAGRYVIFLDSDDLLAEGSLQRLHDKIEERPGADLYPCALLVHNEITGKNEELRDNYPAEFKGELTGPEATRMVYSRSSRPCPMMQLTVCRRDFLNEFSLQCVPGLKQEDNEFTPRALYLARRVVPLHEAFYIYRIRANSVMTSSRSGKEILGSRGIILKSMFEFHAMVSREKGFDRRISSLWARQWLTWLYYYWFSPRAINGIPRFQRHETLCGIFENGFDDFDRVWRASTLPRRIAALFVKLAVRHPSCAWLADKFFQWGYYPLVRLRDHVKAEDETMPSPFN